MYFWFIINLQIYYTSKDYLELDFNAYKYDILFYNDFSKNYSRLILYNSIDFDYCF